MINLLSHLMTVLAKNDLLTVDGILAKNKVIESALRLDPDLLRLLRSSEVLTKTFFQQVDDIIVFDKVKFQSFVSNKQFLPDSFTEYKNKIGLVANKQYLTESNEIVLAFPYKDCVLEGGQTKEDTKRNEVFWNETLAPDEIDRLFEPKVITNFKKFDKDGEHRVESITENDNLIIKGNNLLALHSLKQRYAGTIKLIYIDPPYNTGSDGFNYNDSFNHSTWLTFMRNRLEMARELLSNQGVIFVQCDDNEQAYLKVLMDEIFGRTNLVANFIWNHRKSSQNDIDVSLSHNYTLTYAKDRERFKLNTLDIDGSKFQNHDNDLRGEWVADPFDAPGVRLNLSYEIKNPITGEVFVPPQGRHWRMTQGKFKEALNDNRIIWGKTGKSKPQYKRFKYEAEKKGTNPFTIWSDVGTATEGTQEIMKLFDSKKFATPKPEKLLKQIIRIGTNEGDIVLDFFAGSGTTGAVAHKMKRRYILIEQMDYIRDLPEERLRKVIQGEQGGISKSVNWTGGGSFIYTELKQANQLFVDAIQTVRSTKELIAVWDKMKETAFLSYRISPADIDESSGDFSTLSFENQQRFLISILDKNLLYVPYSEMDDKTYGISNEDKDLNRKFYSDK